MDYREQDRGAHGAYERYLAAMDASMRQKVALTAAHLLCEGDLADMGMGSGSGSFALARLYPQLQVVGIDVNPTMVETARETYQLPNLRFVTGDVAAPGFEAGSLEAILNSSVLHHVSSFNGYRRELAAQALRAQAEQLAAHGVLIVRDFPLLEEAQVWLDLRADDGTADAAQPESCSSAALFERFAGEFRSLLPPEQRGFPWQALSGSDACPLQAGWKRYQLAARHALEFVLRKDYRADWPLEVQEEYGTLSQTGYEALFAELGLRVLASTPLRNPWIVRNRFRGCFSWREVGGAAAELPPTNYVIVGQKVPPDEGVRLVAAAERPRLGYLVLHAWLHRQSERVFDLVRRPGTTVDVLPWFTRAGQLFVLARRSYPRPIAGLQVSASLDGASPACYLTEPLNVQLGDQALGQTVEDLLAEFPAIGRDGILGFADGDSFYPSPGGLQEEVRSVFVEIEPCTVQSPLSNQSGFSSPGHLRAIEARQLLRAAQVGALPEARLEMLAYQLLLRQGRDPGPWIGEQIALADEAAGCEPSDPARLRARPPRRRFRQVEAERSGGFLAIHSAEFHELNAAGQQIGSRVLEYTLPAQLSANTLAVALLRRAGAQILLGVDDDDLPAAQCFSGNSQLLVAPAWRLPTSLRGLEAARHWVADRVQREYGLELGAWSTLGGRYQPSPGATPEVVYPYALEVRGTSQGKKLYWLPLASLARATQQLKDGHLRLLALRAAHALGLLSS